MIANTKRERPENRSTSLSLALHIDVRSAITVNAFERSTLNVPQSVAVVASSDTTRTDDDRHHPEETSLRRASDEWNERNGRLPLSSSPDSRYTR